MGNKATSPRSQQAAKEQAYTFRSLEKSKVIAESDIEEELQKNTRFVVTPLLRLDPATGLYGDTEFKIETEINGAINHEDRVWYKRDLLKAETDKKDTYKFSQNTANVKQLIENFKELEQHFEGNILPDLFSKSYTLDELLKKGLVVSRTAAFDKRNDLRFDLIKIKFMVDFMTLKRFVVQDVTEGKFVETFSKADALNERLSKAKAGEKAEVELLGLSFDVKLLVQELERILKDKRSTLRTI